jgi:PHP family Zn ribbon phosphoesterase
VASKEIDLKVNAEKNKYMVMSRNLHAGQNCKIKTGNKLVEKANSLNIFNQPKHTKSPFLKKFGTVNSRNDCYHSVQNLLSSSFTSKNMEIKIYRTIIFPVVWYECETCL